MRFSHGAAHRIMRDPSRSAPTRVRYACALVCARALLIIASL